MNFQLILIVVLALIATATNAFVHRNGAGGGRRQGGSNPFNSRIPKSGGVVIG